MEDLSPRISVILPTYNRAHVLSDAVKSVLAQTFSQLECIVVDDASTDETEGLVESFGDIRVRFVQHATRRGASAARNTGIQAAEGKYLAFLDSDNQWVPEKLEKQLAVFEADESSELGIVSCGITRIWHGEDGKEIQRAIEIPKDRGWVYERYLAYRAPIGGTSCWLVLREGPEGVLLFDESLSAQEDRDYLLRLTKRARVNTIPEPLVLHHHYAGRHVHEATNVARSRVQILNKYADELVERPKALARNHRLAATSWAVVGDRKQVEIHLLASLKSDPLQPEAAVRLAAAWLGLYPRPRVPFGHS